MEKPEKRLRVVGSAGSASGSTLARRLERGPVPVVDALRIEVAIAGTLAQAHASGVSHRALAPENVLLHPDGRVELPDVSAVPSRRSSERAARGYLAPEQRRGAPEDERSDVFALGVMLFRMLAGELPFPREGAKLGGPAPVLDVPGAPGLGEAVARMLDADPVRRPRDAAEVVATLAPFLEAQERVPSTGSLPARRRHPRARGVARLALGVATAAALAWGTHAARLWGAPAAQGPPAASIAVMPFVDLSPEKSEEYFSDGLTEEILIALARVEGLRVTGRTSSFYFKGRSASLDEIGRELGVATVLEGSVRVLGDRVRISTNLVSVADGRQMWGQSYDRELRDVLAVQDEIARAVAAALEVKLVAHPGAAPNPAAHAKVLMARQQYHRASKESLRLAVKLHEEALAIDPEYAAAWAGLAIPLFHTALDARTPAEYAAIHERALAAAERAVALVPELADGLSARGMLRGLVRQDWEGARRDLERAIALNGSDGDTRRRYGTVLALLGHFPEGIAQVRAAIEIDPLGPAWGTLGALYEESGALDLAAAAFRRNLEIEPEAVPGVVGLGRTLLLQGDPGEALAVFERCGAEEFRLWGEAMARQALGDPAGSQAALQSLAARYGHTSPVRIAEVHAWRGEREVALAWLERASSIPGGFEPVPANPFLRSLREDPRYQATFRKMNLPPQ